MTSEIDSGRSSLGARLFALLIVTIAATLIALSGNGSNLPLVSHESFVARSAEEMMARQDWIVPHFNGHPRINKPPLAYWLTIAVDRLNDDNGLISEWEARVPPIIASVLLACGAAGIGMTLFGGTWIGLVAGLFACASSGYSSYSHSARPEMLYAAFCTLGVLGFSLAYRAQREGSSRTAITAAAWLGWICFGAAVLSKGPHLPVLIIIGWIAGMIAAGHGARIRVTIKPLSGVLLMTAVWIWWYLAIRARVPNWFELLSEETTTGRVFNFDHFGAWSYLDPYYLYRTLGLVMPWFVLYPIVLGAPWLVRESFRGPARILWWSVIAPLVLMHISLGRRWYYLLPVLAPFAVLMAAFALDIARHLIQNNRTKLLIALALVHIMGLAIAVIVLSWSEPKVTTPPLEVIVMVIAAALAGSFALLTIVRKWKWAAEGAVLTVAALACVFFIGGQVRASLWDAARFERRHFALRVAQLVPVDANLLAVDADWAREVYYGHRNIEIYEHADELEQAIESTDREAFLLVLLPDYEQLHKRFKNKTIMLELPIERARRVELWRIVK